LHALGLTDFPALFILLSIDISTSSQFSASFKPEYVSSRQGRLIHAKFKIKEIEAINQSRKKVRSFGRAAWRSIGVTFSSFGRHSRYLPSLSLSPSSARLPHHHYPLTLGSTMKVVLNLLALSATLHLQTSNVAAFGVSTLPGAARPFATSQLRSDAYSYSYGGGGSSAEPQNTSGDAAASSAPGDDGRVVRWFF